MAVDLLVFGPHPDDLEIGAGGIVARHAALGLSVGLCDLTAADLSSNGTVDDRLKEAEAARKALGAAWRENLRFPDRRIGQDPAHVDHVAAFIRRHRPRVVAAPYWIDRHPDHAAASAVVTEAVFNSRLKRYPLDGEPWTVEWICYYFINNNSVPPSFLVDVTDYYARKRAALDCYASQFQAGPNTVSTRLNSPLFRQLIESRDAQFGAQAGVTWAEGVVVREPLLRSTLLKDMTRT